MHRNATPFVGAFAGMLLSVPLSAAMISGFVRADVASALRQQTPQPVSVKPAAATLACVSPASTAAAVGTASKSKGVSPSATSLSSASQPAATTHGSSSATPVFITKLVGGTLAKNNVSVVNAAANAKSVVVAKNEITNTNNNNESNTTVQNASSGKAVVVGNQGAVGGTSTGDATNTNSTSFVENANN